MYIQKRDWNGVPSLCIPNSSMFFVIPNSFASYLAVSIYYAMSHYILLPLHVSMEVHVILLHL